MVLVDLMRLVAPRVTSGALDGARAAARAVGADLVAADRLDTPDDAFFLFLDEIRAPAPDVDLRLVVKLRRETHDEHRRVELVDTTWLGNPEVRAAAPRSASGTNLLRGIGASAGKYEGTVKVLLDAGSQTMVEPGEVLVCPVTDPSWVSLMLVAGALVIDIGGTASHGAIIARELGVPCVIGTNTGTTDLRTGDTVRVNGGTGEVVVLTRSQS
jgi:pyruvate,water dikinase